MTFVPLLASGASLPSLLNYPNFPYIYIYIYLYIIGVGSTGAPGAGAPLYFFQLTSIFGERSEPHTYRTVGKNLRHIYIYVFYIYIYIYIRPYVVHVPLTRALRANVGPAG